MAEQSVREQAAFEFPPEARMMMLDILGRRSDLLNRLNQQINGNERDYAGTLGYKTHLVFNDYVALYRRNPIARRMIRIQPEYIWTAPIDVRDVEARPGEETEFTQAWQALCESHRVLHYCMRADILNNFGHYSGLLLGIAEESANGTPKKLSEPIGTVGTAIDPTRLLFLRPCGQNRLKMGRLDERWYSETYGKPLFYRLDTHLEIDPDVIVESATPQSDATREGTVTGEEVHASRIVHIAEGTLENDLIGQPLLEDVHNTIMDAMKALGGSAEAYWQMIYFGLFVLLNDDAEFAGGEESPELKKFEAVVQRVINQMQRHFVTGGVKDIKTPNTQFTSPRDIVELCFDMIAISQGIPKRKLFGSERGELASSTDEESLLNVLLTRARTFDEPVILRPFIDFCIRYRILPMPKGNKYTVGWEIKTEPSIIERSEILKNNMTSLNLAAMHQTLIDLRRFAEHIDLGDVLTAADAVQADLVDDQAEETDELTTEFARARGAA